MPKDASCLSKPILMPATSTIAFTVNRTARLKESLTDHRVQSSPAQGLHVLVNASHRASHRKPGPDKLLSVVRREEGGRVRILGAVREVNEPSSSRAVVYQNTVLARAAGLFFLQRWTRKHTLSLGASNAASLESPSSSKGALPQSGSHPRAAGAESPS